MTSSENTATPHPGDERAIASVATQFFVNGAVFASFIPRLPEIRDRIDVSLDVLGALMTVGALFGLAGSAVAPGLVERFGTRRVLIWGATVLVATVPLMGFATIPVVFVVALALMHAFDVVVDVAMNLQGSWLSARRHTPIMNRLHGLWSLGTVVGGLLSARLAGSGVSLRDHLVAVAIVLALSLIFVSRGLLRSDVVGGEPASDHDTSAVRRRNRMTLILFALAGAFAIAVEVVSSDWAAFRLSDDFDTSAGFAGLGYVAFTGGMTAGRFGGDWVLARLGRARLLDLATAMAAVGLFGASVAPDRYLVLASYVIAGIAISTFFPMLYDDAAQLPGMRGAGLGALTAGSRAAVVVAPLVIGALAETSLSVGAAIAAITLPSIIGFAIITRLRQAH